MTKELIVNTKNSMVELALLEEGRLVEFHQEKTDSKVGVGDIFLAKISKVTPGLNASFVNIGQKKEGFLHYSDLGPKIKSFQKFITAVQAGEIDGDLDNFEQEPEIDKNGAINEVLKRSELILVQVTKEPISTKGPRLSSEISFAGRFTVLVPFSKQVSISRKIKDPDKRERLLSLLKELCPPNFGIIARTASENQSEEDLRKDIENLKQKWTLLSKALQSAKAPTRIFNELVKSLSILRDLLTDSFEKIVTNNAETASEIKTYVYEIAPELKNIVEHYNGKKPIFDKFKVTKQMKFLFGTNVSLSNGSYIVIEHTEAMNVIDVNSGNKVSAQANQEKNALMVNIAALDEISRQLRLRDLGGIIIIDFIDMKKAENRKLILERMREAMSTDRAKHTILSLTKFGLMQITRQRVRPPINIETVEPCPTCNGLGMIDSPLLILDDIEDDLDYFFGELNYKSIRLSVHPFVEAYIKKGWLNSIQFKWFKRFKKWVDIIPDSSVNITDFKYFGGDDGGELKL